MDHEVATERSQPCRPVGRVGALSQGKAYKLLRALRKHAPNYLGQLWVLASDRRHAKDATAQMAELKADWFHVQKLLGKSRDKAQSHRLCQMGGGGNGDCGRQGRTD